ncbi:MAG: tRNA pseudouridine(55) synthase TruB [Bacilli bacterium]|nr:tRNA pseudouridine(55) synthase TruB [Bacilli bacterium]
MKLESNALLIINKPKDYTSRDIVNIISKKFQTKKVGHNGTLDPLATGVLVICLNRYTKLNEILSSKYKEYIATVKLGIATDTLDITGNVLEKRNIKLNKKDLINTLNKYITTYNQEVPIYSAVKVNGKKLYEYARKKEQVNLPKKEVQIKQIDLLNFNNDEFTFKCLVSKGCYIRSLIRDILNDLNVIGTMSNLQRTKQGVFSIKQANNLEEILKDNYKLYKIKDILDIPKVTIKDDLLKKVYNGVSIKGNYPDTVLFVDENDEEIAIYKKENDLLKMQILLKTPN